MSRPIFSPKDVTRGMPTHPEHPDRPILWLTPGDQWWFRRTTNDLEIRSGANKAPQNARVRYVVCAVKHPEDRGGGFDWTMWQEVEVENTDGITATVAVNVCIPPSFLESEDLLDKSLQVAMIAFNEVYDEPHWVSQYERPASITILHESKAN